MNHAKLLRIDLEWVIDDPQGFLDVLSSILTIEGNYRVCSFQDVGLNDSHSLAKYLPAHKTIAINKTLINDAKTFAAVFIHEVRHLYQHNCIEYQDEFLDIEGKFTIDEWEHDFLHYIPYSEDPEANTKLAVEIDAQAFTKVMLIRLFGIGNYQPSCYLNTDYMKRVEWLMNDFPDDDVQEVLHWELQHGTFVSQRSRTKPNDMA